MKPNSLSSNLGRRTGIHVRALSATEDSEGGETVLCRYSKDGMKSIVYLDVGSVYDALFEIHAVEYEHCGREVKLFIETCPGGRTVVVLSSLLKGQNEYVHSYTQHSNKGWSMFLKYLEISKQCEYNRKNEPSGKPPENFISMQ
eukprot:scaffold33248_cov80-Cyclotella_meneghiniana.AAC.2